MTLDDYQRAAARTMNPGLSGTEQLVDAAAGLSEEAGEVLGLVRKHVYMGHPLDRQRVTRELGDALWCLAALATCLALPLDTVAATNVDKLRRRYPQGFSHKATQRRTGDDSTEHGG